MSQKFIKLRKPAQKVYWDILGPSGQSKQNPIFVGRQLTANNSKLMKFEATEL